MESKVSRRLNEPLAREICEHIYGPRLARDFTRQFPYLTEVNQAHLLMLHKTGLVSPEVARRLAGGLQQMETEGPDAVTLDPAREDPYFNYEARLMEVSGRDIGGRLHMARSRNDIAATIDRMRTRSIVLDTIEALGSVRRVALQRAGECADAVMPGYTHLQPAQPITFGFYLSAVAEALGRDMDRLHASLARIDAMPLGAGALAGTRFPIDRRVSAAALGFGSLVHNTLDAVASRDFAWEAMSAMAIVALTWGRVAQDFYVWSTPEFGLLSFPDRVASTSSIMPQKKNPAVLEYLRGKSAHVVGLLTTALIAVKGTHFTHTGDSSRESIRSFWECCEETARCLSLFELVVGSVEPRRQSMLQRVRFDFSVATDLADGLVADAGLSFRDAHHVVGGLVRIALDAGQSAGEVTSTMLDRAAVDVIGRAIEWPEDKLRQYLDPVESVNARRNGGPAPSEVALAIERQQAHLETVLASVMSLRQRLDAARDQMKRDIAALAAA
ncbi:argininosuccinate lyase [Cupriavidus oxalaticus]|uniref:argininosuccinate lyase n=1 Tax=Cupriavidus oxalaticus TaxID=96344 RepID=UPI00317A8A02